IFTLAALIILSANFLRAQDASISFDVNNVECHVPDGTPWMFDADDPMFPLQDDGNPFTYSNIALYQLHNHAYYDFYTPISPWDAAFPYSSSCTAENLDFVEGTAGFEIRFDDYELRAFEHINAVNPGLAWNTLGQAGDSRTYVNGISNIYHNEVLVLSVKDCVIDVQVHYPDADQMRQVLGTAHWQNDVGSGQGTFASGWGIVDVENSDPQWVAVFADPNVGNRVNFTMTSVNNTVQNEYGYFSFDLDIATADHAVQQAIDAILIPEVIEFIPIDMTLDFHTVDLGGPNNDLGDLLIFMVEESPDGNFPEEIESLYRQYWQLGTTLEAFSTDITFTVDGFGDSSFWQVLRRGEGEGSWQIWNDITILDANRIRANNVNAFSDWAIGSTSDDTLPVVLSSFTAVPTAQMAVKLNWTTQSEAQMAGFCIFRSSSDQLTNALQISNLISATNTSLTQNYEYIDMEVYPNSTYYYWLQQSEITGECSFHGPITVYVSADGEGEGSPDLVLNTAIRRIFPNPSASPTIDVSLAKDSQLQISVYNLRGQLIRKVFEGNKSEGIHYIHWDGRDSAGTTCASGVYFVALKTDGKEIQRSRLILHK
ncbi:MAG: T9SS type A sorting domain-containing protein, partial [Candidatus Cloacimonetes bacterium]|nr:T9SS type A sorting domain-containing protein [Candidatus Cloacimonadota bacterium]